MVQNVFRVYRLVARILHSEPFIFVLNCLFELIIQELLSDWMSRLPILFATGLKLLHLGRTLHYFHPTKVY